MGSKKAKKIDEDEEDPKPVKDKKEKKRKNQKDESESKEKKRKKSIDETEHDENNDDDHETPNKDKKHKKSKDESKKDRKKSIDETEDEGKSKKVNVESEIDDEQVTKHEDKKAKDTTNVNNKNKKVKGNPEGITRLFLGNLPFKVDEGMIQDFLPGCTHIKWITDKLTGKFYGSAFVEMSDSVAAASAVARSGEQIMKRPIKINFAPAKQGEIWPPKERVVSGGQKNDKGKASIVTGIAGMKSEKPDGCVKLFLGNLSYDIDDDKIKEFFATVEAEVKAVRWIYHKDSGDFKGVGYVEFWKPEVCERAATLNGKVLLGRPIRIDWTD